jgi:peptide/nickel transport system substrate-binding protein
LQFDPRTPGKVAKNRNINASVGFVMQQTNASERLISQFVHTIKWGRVALKRKLFSVLILFMLLLNMGVVVFNVRPVRAAGTIYIHSDGSIEPLGAPITTSDNATYLLMNDTFDSIIIERSNILFHGNDHSVQGSGNGTGILLLNWLVNVTIEDIQIINWANGIYMPNIYNSSVLQNSLLLNQYGVHLSLSYNNIVSGNTIINCTAEGIRLSYSSNNTISKNNIETNYVGIQIQSSTGNTFYHNNFIYNAASQAYAETGNSTNAWDGGYPWCGNYWSNYNGTDLSSGPFQNETEPDRAGDTSYAIDSVNIDKYPLMNPWASNFTITSHMVVGSQYSPRSLDPVCAWDTASMELLMNVYEPLTFFDEEKTDQFVPRLATDWEISPDGLTYSFKIRQGVKYHNDEVLTTEDVEYSFERMFVIEYSTWLGMGPSFFFYDAFFNVFGSRDENGSFIVAGQQIDDAITRNETVVTLHLAKPYAPLLQMLSMTYGSILCKKWCTQIGDWPGTWNNWTLYNRPTKTAIENQTSGPPGPRTDAMCGTGPFMLEYYSVDTEWQLLKFNGYWGGWPAPGSGGSLRRIKMLTISDPAAREGMLLDARLDHTEVPETEIDEVLGQPGIRSVYPLEQLMCEAFFFTFNISTSSPLMGVPGGLPKGRLNESGIPPDFFTDINVRKGFAYAFNYTKLIAEALLGEAYQSATPIIPGLPYSNPAQEKYSVDMTMAAQFFSQAWGGQLWSSGFNFTLCYNEGNTNRQKICEILKANIESLNPKFHLQVEPEPLSFYSDVTRNHEAPIFFYGWLADYADPHDFAIGFMYSTGAFPEMQLYSNSTIDSLVMQGIGTMNETARREIYYELQMLYHEDCPSVPLYQPMGRRLERTWVQGWYYNPLLLGDYFYTEWKGAEFNSTRYSWPMFRHDPTHGGYTESPPPTTNQTRWDYLTGGTVNSSPAVVDGKTYAGSTDGLVYCLDAYNGTQLWNCTVGVTDSSPAVAYGKVYIGSYDAKIYCLDATTGAQIWNYTTAGYVRSSPAVVDGRICVGSLDGNVYCLDAMTGASIWNRTIGAAVVSSPAMVGGKVYVGAMDGIVYCLDATNGGVIWTCIAGLSIPSSPAVIDGRVYFGADNGTFYCLDATVGTLIWKQYVAGSLNSSAAVSDGKVFLGSLNGQIVCLSALTGEYLWNCTVGGVYSSPAVAGKNVYVGSLDKNVYCFDADTGVPIWSYVTGGEILCSPAVADGMIFLGSNDGKVYALGNVIRVPMDYGTIQEAINAAEPGATIWVAPGIYNEAIIINKTITLIGKIGSEPIFNGGGTGIAITIVPSGSGSTVAGFVITSWDQGLLVKGASNCKIYDNIMSVLTQNGITLQGSSCSGNAVYCNIFEKDAIAINVTSSASGNVIRNNIISLSGVGLELESSGNQVCANAIMENVFAMSLQSSNNNLIFHNNFVNNDNPLSIAMSTGNVWDDGYSSGGNYWACHVSIDNFGGPFQNETGADGIVDVPFAIAPDNVDRYPLLEPFNLHNIGTTRFLLSKTVIGKPCSAKLNLTVQNLGMFNEQFTLTVLVDTTLLMQQTISLSLRQSDTVIVIWDTTGVAKGNYTLKASTAPVPDETETGDNTLSRWVVVTISGDINGDFIVDIFDAILLANSFNSYPSHLKWNPNADIKEDNVVDIFDAIMLANNFNKIA